MPLEHEDLHRPLPQGVALDAVLSIKTPHVLRNDFTVAHEGKLYQVEDNIRSKEIIVENRISGRMYITYKGRALRYKQITALPKKVEEKAKKPDMLTRKEPYAISQDHPWKRFRLPGSHAIKTQEEAFAGAL